MRPRSQCEETLNIYKLRRYLLSSSSFDLAIVLDYITLCNVCVTIPTLEVEYLSQRDTERYRIEISKAKGSRACVMCVFKE